MIPIYIINLPGRIDRLKDCKALMDAHKLSYRIFPAVRHDDGRKGLKLTMIKLFDTIKDDKVLVLEDDVDFIADINTLLPAAMKELPRDFDLLFLGANVYRPMDAYSDHLMRLSGAVANHAVIYTRRVMDLMKKVYAQPGENPTDVLLDHHVVHKGKSFVTYPQIATQRPSYSDIEKKNVDYSCYLIDPYNKHCNR